MYLSYIRRDSNTTEFMDIYFSTDPGHLDCIIKMKRLLGRGPPKTIAQIYQICDDFDVPLMKDFTNWIISMILESSDSQIWFDALKDYEVDTEIWKCLSTRIDVNTMKSLMHKTSTRGESKPKMEVKERVYEKK